MNIDNCLILAAGLGTRMGKVGSVLPKVMWPIFDKSLIELEILYAKKLGAKKIFINLHYQHELIKKHIEEKFGNEVTFLYELPDILDIGGAIHNLAKSVSYQGNLLVINSDQFLFFPTIQLQEALNLLDNHKAVLFAIEVNKAGKYNQTLPNKNNHLQEIIKLAEVKEEKYLTYSGCSVIRLDKLKSHAGPSNFFDTVATYKTDLIPMITLKNLIYWDFGTKDRYVQSIKRVIEMVNKHKSDSFIDFLFEHKALDKKLLGNETYRAKTCISFTQKTNLEHKGSIILGGNQIPHSSEAQIGLNDCWDVI